MPEAESRLSELLADSTQAGRSNTLAPEEEEGARYLRGRMLYFKGDFDGAHAELDRVVDAFRRGETVNDCLDLLFLLDAAGDARDDFRQVANADYLVFRGDLAAAAGILDPLVTRGGALGAEAGWRRAGIARTGGKPADALALLDQVVTAAEEPLRSRALEEAAAISRDDLHDQARARRYLEAILTADPDGSYADRARRALDALPHDLP